jgi:hypothetical protein
MVPPAMESCGDDLGEQLDDELKKKRVLTAEALAEPEPTMLDVRLQPLTLTTDLGVLHRGLTARMSAAGVCRFPDGLWITHSEAVRFEIRI